LALDFPDNPTTNQTYTEQNITWQYDGEKWNILITGGPTYVTALPSGTIPDGREIYYAVNTDNGIIWHLRYRSAARSGSGAWEFLGGQPLTDRRDEWALHTSDSTSNRTVNLQSNNAAQTGPSLTLPAFGKYVIDYGAHMWNDTSNGGSRIALAWSGGSAISNTDIDQYTANVAFALDSSFRKIDLVRTSGSLVLDMVYYRRTAAGTANVSTRFMYATPVYIY
jgi:hypothetical protein